MDTFDNSVYPEENQAPQTGAEGTSPYRGVGVGRKESPYANSPYVMPHQAQQGGQPQQPAGGYQQPQQAQQTADGYQQPQQAQAGQQAQQAQPGDGGYQQPRQTQQPQGTYQRTYYYQPEQPPVEQPRKPKTRKKKSGGRAGRKVLAAVLALVLVAGSCAVTAGVVNSGWEKRAAQMEADFSQKLAGLQSQIDSVSEKADQQIILGSSVSENGMTPAQVYAQNVDAVVMVTCNVTSYSYGQPITGTSTGSGFIISEDGYVMTNCHVVEGASSVSIITHSGEQYAATVIGSDSTSDVALLKVEASGLPAVTLGSSDELIVGDQVVAIGNPLGELTSTMTVGYVSGKERAVYTDDTTINMIQTDAAINSGNSGGPLFNMKGEVVGITTAKYSGESSSGASIEGIGFAIPIDDAMEVVGDLQEFGYVKTAYMGVTVRDMDSSVASMYNLPAGVYVDSVEAGGPAALAGIQAEDIIIGLGDETITSYNDLAKALRGYEPGETTTVTVYRGGRELELTITLTERPDEISTEEEQSQSDSQMPSEGSYEDWYEYFAPFFGGGNGNNGG